MNTDNRSRILGLVARGLLIVVLLTLSEFVLIQSSDRIALSVVTYAIAGYLVWVLIRIGVGRVKSEWRLGAWIVAGLLGVVLLAYSDHFSIGSNERGFLTIMLIAIGAYLVYRFIIRK